MSEPFFSIIIPTRNRYHTLKYSILTVLNQDFGSFELIISDNSDPANYNQAASIEEYLKLEKVRYHRPPAVLAMADSWEFAVSKASGKFLILFGDDDGLVEGALSQIYQIIQKTQTRLVSWARVEYSWPDRLPAIHSNLLVMPYTARTGVVDSRKYINKVIRYNADYRFLPMFYNSAVSRETVELLRAKAGRVFNASSPDLFTGYAFAHLQKEYITIGYPLTINGVSATSNGAAYLNQDEATLTDFWTLLKKSQINWPASLPEVNSPYIAIIEPFLQLTKFLPELHSYITRKEIYKTIVNSVDAVDEEQFDLKIKKILERAEDDKPFHKWLKTYVRNIAPKINQDAGKEHVLGFDGTYLILDGSKFGLRNVLEVSKFTKNIFGNLKDTDFVKPAVPGLYKRVRKAAAFVLKGV